MTQISPKIKRQEYLHITVRFKITADIIFICSNYPPQHCSRNNSSHIYQITNVFHCRMRSMIQLPLLISKSTNIDFKWKSYIFYLFSAIYILCGVSNKMDTMRIIQILFFSESHEIRLFVRTQILKHLPAHTLHKNHSNRLHPKIGIEPTRIKLLIYLL